MKKAKGRSVHKGEKVEKVEKSPSVAKISPLQQYIHPAGSSYARSPCTRTSVPAAAESVPTASSPTWS